MDTEKILEVTEEYCAPNYLPLPVVITKAEGVWVEDPEGNRYLDMLSSYSALNQGHRHPRIIKAVKNQLDEVTLTSRAFQNEKLGLLCKKLVEITGKEKALVMNTGAEAVETAIKLVRRWAYMIKGIAQDKAEIIVCAGNFHGRTTTIVSFSSSPSYYSGFGPLTPGFKIIPYGDLEALQEAINENTAAFLVEPIQGEAGVVIPPAGYLKKAKEICEEREILFVADEIQTGFGRTGRLFASQWEDVVPDIFILGKALGGGVIPVSSITGKSNLLDLFNPGSHGSTFGGNPLGCACALEAIAVTLEEDLVSRSLSMGEYFQEQLSKIKSPVIKEVRGRGLFIGVELHTRARSYCEALMEEGVLCKETHENVIRFAPPLVIEREEIDWGVERVASVF